MLEFNRGHIIPTAPVSAAATVRLIDNDHANKILETWDQDRLFEIIEKRLIVKQILQSKQRERQLDNFKPEGL